MCKTLYFVSNKNKSKPSNELSMIINFIGQRMYTLVEIKQHFENEILTEHFSIPVNLNRIRELKSIVDRLVLILLAGCNDGFLGYFILISKTAKL